MNAASLPYTVLILLVELAVGSLAMLTVFDARRQVTVGYVKAGAMLVLPLALLAAWTVATLESRPEVDGYALAEGWLRPFTLALAAFVVCSAMHAIAAFTQRHRAGILLGAAGSAAGVVALVLLAGFLAPPAWSFVGLVLSVLTSTAVLGGSLMAMTWGHWYLTSGRLPKEPMEQMTLVVLVSLVMQGILVLAGAALPARDVPLSDGAEIGLAVNPAFWLRVGVGLAFPIGVTWLAFRAARIRGMMSATGLLYIALGAILAGEVLARGLLFTTGSAV
ncbi:MAG: hypothetical protein C4558_03965 [Dehalococcoidia bacterium]|nr:MAG: hypothetical protein C4558_03965 [Dehalococcoidia bacterium]